MNIIKNGVLISISSKLVRLDYTPSLAETRFLGNALAGIIRRHKHEYDFGKVYKHQPGLELNEHCTKEFFLQAKG